MEPGRGQTSTGSIEYGERGMVKIYLAYPFGLAPDVLVNSPQSLGQYMDRAVVQAFHLGLTRNDLRKKFEERMAMLDGGSSDG